MSVMPENDEVELGPAGPTRTEALLASADFEPLLDRLEKFVADEARKTFRPPDREVLRSIISMHAMAYEGSRFMTDEVSQRTLHQLAAPLARVIELLQFEANLSDVLVALGAPVMLAISPDQRSVEQAVARYVALLRDLDKIARAVPSPPTRGRGRPPRKNLREMVERLADYWLSATGKQFSQHWHKGEPVNRATQFVHAVVNFIDSESLVALPKVTEKVVTKRRVAAGKTRNRSSRNASPKLPKNSFFLANFGKR
jgi:hypothetical protein